MADGRLPPSYSDVVAETRHQRNTLPHLTTYLTASINNGFENDSFQSSQQLPLLDVNTIEEAPPTYIDAIETPSDQQKPVCNSNIKHVCFSTLFLCVSSAVPITLIVLGEFDNKQTIMFSLFGNYAMLILYC